MKNHYYHDVLIIGSGATGLTVAINVSLKNLSKKAILIRQYYSLRIYLNQTIVFLIPQAIH
ncbi:MAG: hypothetical protein LBL17_05130 [Coxiellaceae bacterium]|jgi:thioredoxin reductase|nr:hypothetical protein [Coxiellaceae bacterium]